MNHPSPLTSTTNNTVREYVSSVTAKGMITIPQEVRKSLNIKPKSQVVIRFNEDNVIIKPLPMTLEETFGSVTPLNRPENFAELIQTAKEERTQTIISEMNP